RSGAVVGRSKGVLGGADDQVIRAARAGRIGRSVPGRGALADGVAGGGLRLKSRGSAGGDIENVERGLAQRRALERDAGVGRRHVHGGGLDQVAVIRIDGVSHGLGAVIGRGDAVILIAYHERERGRFIRNLRDVPVGGGHAALVGADTPDIHGVVALLR